VDSPVCTTNLKKGSSLPSPPVPSPNPQEKRGGPFTHQMTSEEVLIGCMEIIILPLFLAWTKLIALPKNTLPSFFVSGGALCRKELCSVHYNFIFPLTFPINTYFLPVASIAEGPVPRA